MKLLSLLLAPTLALAGTFSGSVTLLDGTPVAGAVVRSLTDSVTASGSGTFTLARATGIVPRSAKTIPVTSHLVVENGRPRLSFAGMDISGRARNSATARQIPSNPDRSLAARSLAAPDTLKVYWKGKRLTVLPVASDTTVLFKIDTAWKDDAGIPWNPSITYGSLFDSRDGQTYRTVTIGSQTWMAENLSFMVDSSWWYTSIADSASKYGFLYPWSITMGLADSCDKSSCANQVQAPRQGICPAHWHVPLDTEWSILQIGADSLQTNEGQHLKSTAGWMMGRGTDDFGFRGIPSGYRYGSGTLFVNGSSGDWWTASVSSGYARICYLTYFNNILTRYVGAKTHGRAIRCIKD